MADLPETFSLSQRQYVLACEHTARLAPKVEAARRRIEDARDRSETEKAEARAKLTLAARKCEEAVEGFEEAILRVGEELPAGDLYDRIRRALEAEEAQGVDVLAKMEDGLREARERGIRDLAQADRNLAAIEHRRRGRRPPV